MASNKTAEAALAGNNLIVVLVVVSFLVVGITVLADKTLLSTIIRDQKVVEAKDKAAKQMQQNAVNAPQLVADYRQLGDLQRIVKDALPTSQDTPGILVTMENMAAQSGVKLKSVVPVPQGTNTAVVPAASSEDAKTSADGVPQPQTIKFTATFDGTYESVVKLMKAIEMSARPMRIVNLQLSGSGKALSAQVEVQTFYQDKALLPIVTETIQ